MGRSYRPPVHVLPCTLLANNSKSRVDRKAETVVEFGALSLSCILPGLPPFLAMNRVSRWRWQLTYQNGIVEKHVRMVYLTEVSPKVLGVLHPPNSVWLDQVHSIRGAEVESAARVAVHGGEGDGDRRDDRWWNLGEVGR